MPDNLSHICLRARLDLACLLAEVAAAAIQADTPAELVWACEVGLDLAELLPIKKPGD
jgi:hypothetical protein